MRFGESLREERERRGISLDDVSVATRVSVRHLQALESDHFADLPGGVFNRGIVRSYAQFCGLDADTTLQGFNAAVRASGLEEELKDNDLAEFAEAVQRGRTPAIPQPRLRWFGVVAMMTGVLVLAAGVLWLLVHRGIVHLPQKRRVVAAAVAVAVPSSPGGIDGIE
jgi:cytoskeletal protein RodZ